jgi:hypothetical protein
MLTAILIILTIVFLTSLALMTDLNSPNDR